MNPSEKSIQAIMQAVIQDLRAIGIQVPADHIHGPFWNKRAHSFLGRCRKTGKEYQIELSADLLAGTEEDLRAVLFHELLHTMPGCMNHGARWKAYGERVTQAYGITVSRVGDREAHGLPERKVAPVRYVLVCQTCGGKIQRRRRSALVDHPERYRCGKCGGVLVLIER